MLNMRSAAPHDADRTTRARIRDAALWRFAQDGFAAGTVRTIAADAGVSPALVMHHYESKQGLRQTCEDYLIAVVEQKFAALDTGGDTLDAWTALVDERLPLIPFLGRVLADGGESATRLLRRLVTSTERTLDDWQRKGRVRPSTDPHARAVVVLSWDLSRVLLADQIRAATDIDPQSGQGLARLSMAALDIYVHGLLVDSEWTRTLTASMQALRDQPPDHRGHAAAPTPAPHNPRESP